MRTNILPQRPNATQPGLRCIRIKMHQATRDVLSQILQAGLDHGIIRADFLGHPLTFLVRVLVPHERPSSGNRYKTDRAYFCGW